MSYLDVTYSTPRAVVVASVSADAAAAALADLRGDAPAIVVVSVTVTADKRGDEVVLLMLKPPADPGAGRPRQMLGGFRRVSLDPAVPVRVGFELTPHELAIAGARTYFWQRLRAR